MHCKYKKHFLNITAAVAAVCLISMLCIVPDTCADGRGKSSTVYKFIVIGKMRDRATKEMTKASYSIDDPDRVVVVLDPEKDRTKVEECGYEYPGKPVTYICTEKTCFPPAYTADGVRKSWEIARKAR